TSERRCPTSCNPQFKKMKLSVQWIREFVDIPVDDRRLVEDLTSVGIAVEGISGEGVNTVFEMEIGTNRPDAMNHYGVAREAAAFYAVPLKPIELKLPHAAAAKRDRSDSAMAQGAPGAQPLHFEIEIEDKEGCARYTAQTGCSRRSHGWIRHHDY